MLKRAEFVRSAMVVVIGSTLLSLPARATTYIFSTFKGDTAPEEKLSIYTSTDAVNFNLLSDTGFVGSSGTLRDPSIMKHSDGKYYVAYTNPPTASCCGNADHFSIAVSTDLLVWQDVAIVKSGVTGVAHTWAPEWLLGDDVVKVVANIDTGNGDFKPYAFTPMNSSLTSWSGPTLLGIGPNYIDTCVVKSAGTYHAFTKNETTRFLEHATAPGLTGPWTFVGTGDWAGLGAGGFEGPTIVKLDDGTWRMYLDPQTRGVPCKYMNSRDLNSWSAPANLPGAAGLVVRHGTVIRDEAGSGSTGAGGNGVGSGGRAGGGGLPGSLDGGAFVDAAGNPNQADDARVAQDSPLDNTANGTGSSDGNGSGGTSGGGGGSGSGSLGGSAGGPDTGSTAGAGASGRNAASRQVQAGCGCRIARAPDSSAASAIGVAATLLGVHLRRRRPRPHVRSMTAIDATKLRREES